MTITKLQEIFNANQNKENAIKQEAYLKNQFKFLGIAKPDRARLEKQFVNETKLLSSEEIIAICFKLYNHEYREYKYVAQSVLKANYKKFDFAQIDKLTKLTLIDSWWENTDGFQSFLRNWLKINPSYIAVFVNKYCNDSDMWMRRLAIIAQLGLKAQTDFAAMSTAIEVNFDEDQFFIQKAIGWALRDYSKHDRLSVSTFIDENKNKLSKLALREGSKYL